METLIHIELLIASVLVLVYGAITVKHVSKLRQLNRTLDEIIQNNNNT